MEINRVKKLLEMRDKDLCLSQSQLKITEERAADLDAEMEMKSGENNRLRKQVADIEAAMQDLYKSRKGKGTLEIEMDSLKSDNEHLL
jgi:septal ring factor EnvC (AmiA/AmiB activator)